VPNFLVKRQLRVFENLAYYSHVWRSMSHFVDKNHLLYHKRCQNKSYSKASHDYERQPRYLCVSLKSHKTALKSQNTFTAVKVNAGESQPQKIGTDHCLVG
jgi:hypothetical protein